LGVYEQGSTFKVLNAAIALETGVATPGSIFDASNPIYIGHFKITDFKGKNRPLSLVEAVVYSSNLAAIQIAKKFGPKVQKKFMEKFGILQSLSLEIPELGSSLSPKDWRETSMMTIAYGYGIATTPLHSLTAIAAIANDGFKPSPTLQYVPTNLRQARIDSFKTQQCVSKKTSQTMRQMMCLVISEGMPIKANIECYKVFGKTGTAYKSAGKRGYGAEGQRSRTTSFIGGFPANDPQYVMIVMLDDPKAISETHGYATAGWNAKPVTCAIIERIAPLLNVKPDFEENDFSLESMQQFTSFTPSEEDDD
jgi:cell division protein FtsI (penicillin-binding protein 3)